MSGTDILMVNRPAETVGNGIWTLGGQGNSLVIDHGDGLLLVDAGPGREITDAMIRGVRSVSGKPVTHIVISHGHLGYNFGVEQWRQHAASRGEPRPILVGHERVPARYRRYRETAGLQSYTNTRQFRTPYPTQWPDHWFVMPDLTYHERMCITGTSRDIELISAPSETDDATAVWLPAERLLYGSCAFIKACPNAGSPFRILRDPLRWVETLERFLSLQPAVLIPEFGKPLNGRADIEEALTIPIRAIRWLRKEVVERMNRGMTEVEIIHDLKYPDDIFSNRFLKPVYGCPEYLVREIWRTENGWWDRNPTHLHPAAPDESAAEIFAAIGDPRRVLNHARKLSAEGRVQLALHVVDLVALAKGNATEIAEARTLKAQLLEARAKELSSVVSRQILQSEAEILQGLPVGSSDRTVGRERFQWS
jgi:glyoxylase-like metal-dependent hydrolase (beta-lactamase superfamily II)